MRKAVIFDIDDLLIDTTVRKIVYDNDKLKLKLHIVKKDYENGEYFIYDGLLPFAVDITTAFKNAGYVLVYITGRRKSMLDATYEQFNLLGIPYERRLIFHKDTKEQNTTNYKGFIYDRLKRKGLDVQYFFDDAVENCEMAETKGIPHIYLSLNDFLSDFYTDSIETDVVV
tara:strand:+ start:8196 stop:8708 length:513 start_codon:yes stop_codon:yes gene_type:complete